MAAALLGAAVRMVGAVGSDAYAGPALKHLRCSGVDLSAVETVEGATGLAVVTVAADGENTIVVVPGANAAVDTDAVAAHSQAVAGADIVLLQGEIPASGFAAAVRLATGRVVVNLAPVVKVDRTALLAADPLVANEHEAGLILAQFGAAAAPRPGDAGDIGGPGDAEEAAATALVELGFRSVVVTRGAHGCVVADAAGVTAVPAPKVTAVDSTGAGDAFVGALVRRLEAGDCLVEAARFASRVGAFAATRRGAQTSYPTQSDALPGADGV